MRWPGQALRLGLLYFYQRTLGTPGDRPDSGCDSTEPFTVRMFCHPSLWLHQTEDGMSHWGPGHCTGYERRQAAVGPVQ